MAAQPLLDLATIDLARVLHGPEVLDRYRAQRGRFAMLDGILHEDVEGRLVVGFKDVRAGDWWASDHIPGRPIFPGALMVECAAQLATYDYLKHRGAVGAEEFVGFGGLDRTRFRGLVVPDCRLVVAARLERSRSRMFLYATQGFVAGELVFDAEVRGVVV